jgi:hypothetical protein
MNDPYPSTIDIEIDRAKLKKYLRVKWFLSWTGPLTGFAGMFGVASAIGAVLERGKSLAAGLVLAGEITGGAFLLSTCLYLILSHHRAARLAATLQVSVEGAFLRIRQDACIRSDRKLHFRSIVDYTVVQGWLMRRFGLEGLYMSTLGGNPYGAQQSYQNGLMVLAVKDCLKIRDLLSDIDRTRENQ